MPDKKRRFDEDKFNNIPIVQIIGPEIKKGQVIVRDELKDFIDSEIVRAQLEVLEKVRPTYTDENTVQSMGYDECVKEVNINIDALKSEIVEGKG